MAVLSDILFDIHVTGCSFIIASHIILGAEYNNY
jgi:hypothetical protein